MALFISSLLLFLLYGGASASTSANFTVSNITTTQQNAPTETQDDTANTTDNVIDIPLPFQIEGDITECGQALTGRMHSYYGPQVYRFDFAEWSSALLFPEAQGAIGGYYTCEGTELEQAQVFGLMAQAEILGLVNAHSSCGTTKSVKVLSAAKQVVAGVNYRVNVEACDGSQLALISFLVPLPSDNDIEKPINVSFVRMTDATFTIDPCGTLFPLKIEPVISAEHYNDRRFYDDQYVPVFNNSVQCPNGLNWQWSFTPNTTRFGTEYIISWIGVRKPEAARLYTAAVGDYNVAFQCSVSATSPPTTTTGIEIPLPFQLEGDITTCGQVLTGVMDPYYEIAGGDPEVYRFDFEQWSATNLISEQELSSGYYLCIATQLEQAQLFGRMAQQDILSAVNGAATCGATKKVHVISAAKQVEHGAKPGVNYRANVVACDGEQVVLVSFFVPLPSDNDIQIPSSVQLISVRNSTFIIDPCDTEYPLQIEPLISIANYGERRFYDEMYLPVDNNSVACPNGHNWQWSFTPNVTRYGTEYVVSWLGMPGSDAFDVYDDTDGSYSVTFECTEAASTTREPSITRSSASSSTDGSKGESKESGSVGGLDSVPGYVWLILLIVSVVAIGVLLHLWLSAKKQLELLGDPSSRYQQLQNEDATAHPL